MDALTRSEERLFALLEDISCTLRVIADRDDMDSKQSRAIRLLFEVGPNLAEIARRVGVSRQTLYNWKTFQEAKDRIVGTRHAPKLGADWTLEEF